MSRRPDKGDEKARQLYDRAMAIIDEEWRGAGATEEELERSRLAARLYGAGFMVMLRDQREELLIPLDPERGVLLGIRLPEGWWRGDLAKLLRTGEELTIPQLIQVLRELEECAPDEPVVKVVSGSAKA